MIEVDINTLVTESTGIYKYLIEDIPNNIKITGIIDNLCISYIYFNLDLSGVKCDDILYSKQKGNNRIKYHILPSNLSSLSLEYNEINDLPILPDSLIELFCHDNHLIKLPDNLPSSLEILQCYNNKITHLHNNLPNSLIELHCSNNKITHLPNNLPNSLIELHCDNNQLVYFDNVKLPDTLQHLNCSNNYLLNLPEILPKSLHVLNCDKNKLIYLPKLHYYIKLIYSGELSYIEYTKERDVLDYDSDIEIKIGNMIIEDNYTFNEYMNKLLESKYKSAKK